MTEKTTQLNVAKRIIQRRKHTLDETYNLDDGWQAHFDIEEELVWETLGSRKACHKYKSRLSEESAGLCISTLKEPNWAELESGQVSVGEDGFPPSLYVCRAVRHT